MMEVTVNEFWTLANGGVVLRPRWAEGWRQKLSDLVVFAGSKSNYLAKKLLDLPIGAVAFTAATPLYFALWTSALDDTSTGATSGEAAYTGYARTTTGTNNTTNWPSATGTTTATKSNANAVTFPASTGGSSTVTYMCLVDSSSGAGNIYYWCSVTSATVNTGDTPQVAASGFSVVED